MATDPTQVFQTTVTDPLQQVQTMAGGPPAGDPRVRAQGKGNGLDRPHFGSYIPQGLVQMLLRMQAMNPDRFAMMLGRPRMERFGITPETDLANLYTRQMARQDFRGGTDPMAAGTILTPEQRAGYPAMRPMPSFTSGMGNQAPAGAPAQPDLMQPVGMARRTAPGGNGNTGY